MCFRPHTTDNNRQNSKIIDRQTFLIFVGLVFIKGPFGARTFFLEVAK